MLKSISKVLETNGNERDALKLHSITLISLSFDKNCILNGPVILRYLHIFFEIFLIFFVVSIYNFWAGKINVASPEWTPAFSTCSEIA